MFIFLHLSAPFDTIRHILLLEILSLLEPGRAFPGTGLNSSLSLAVGSDPPTACCFSYTARKIPRNFVKDYYSTSSMCSQPGIVFITKRGRELCANPSESWVEEYVADLELN
uniref:C-C motif chemokine n=1 Tax=Chelonoidis abingdonii TaxID=106734 RepID=A0A8C0G9N5_CHEAB